jgi:hypothetical protein
LAGTETLLSSVVEIVRFVSHCRTPGMNESKKKEEWII